MLVITYCDSRQTFANTLGRSIFASSVGKIKLRVNMIFLFSLNFGRVQPSRDSKQKQLFTGLLKNRCSKIFSEIHREICGGVVMLDS